MRQSHMRATLFLSTIMVSGFATPAMANVAAAAVDDSAAVEAPDRQPGEVEIQDDVIVVTATKRETNLQDTPISISVVSDDMIKTRHVQSLLDLGDGSVPSLRVAPFESRQSALAVGMRGIVPLDANQPAREQGVGIYIDGVYLGRQHGLNSAMLDIERIEVLKGPQGTLFGRNTEGGAVNMVTRMPTGEFGVRGSAGIGNFGAYTGTAHIDLPAIGNLALKIDGALQHQNETVKNPLADQKGWGYYHRWGVRGSARWTPTDDLTVDLAYDIGRDKNTPQYSQLINYNPTGLCVGPVSGSLPKCTDGRTAIRPLAPAVEVNADRVSVGDIGVPQRPNISKTEGFMGVVTWDINDDMTFKSITAWRSVDDDQWDNSGGAHRTPAFTANGLFSRYSLSQLTQEQSSQEFQLIGSLPTIDYVLGLYYFQEHAEDAAATPNTNRWNADGTGYTIVDECTGSNGYGSLPGCRSFDRASRAKSKSYAAYGQATWTPGGLEQLHLTIGGRYTEDKKSGVLYKVSNRNTNLTFSEKSNRFDPLVTLAYDVTDDVNVYAKYATGYRAGGASSRSLTYRSFGPEAVKSYELGLKSEFMDRRVRLNLAAYMMDRTGTQIDFNFYNPITNRNTLETVNAPGKTKIRGVEAELTVRPVEGLTLGVNYAYTYAKIPETPNPLVTGNPIQKVFIPYTPKHAASGSLDYHTLLGSGDLGVRFHLDGNYASRAYSFDNEDVLADSSFIVNGRLSLTDISLGGVNTTLSIWSRNLLNEAHIYRRSNANRLTLGDYANFNTPRTYGVELSFKM